MIRFTEVSICEIHSAPELKKLDIVVPAGTARIIANGYYNENEKVKSFGFSGNYNSFTNKFNGKIHVHPASLPKTKLKYLIIKKLMNEPRQYFVR